MSESSHHGRVKKILITGFEPFADFLQNPSGTLALALDLQSIQGLEIHGRVLPVSYRRSQACLSTWLQEEAWDAVICVGIAGHLSCIALEKVAINVNIAGIPDNDRDLRVDVPIDPRGPAAYFSNLPVARIEQSLVEAGFESKVSLSAGGYVCNHVFYHLMHEISKRKSRTLGGFIHVPTWNEPEKERFAETELQTAFLKIIEAIARHLDQDGPLLPEALASSHQASS